MGMPTSTPFSPLPSGSPSLHDLRARLADIDGEIDALKRKMLLLNDERCIILKTLDSLRYPVLTFPPELTGMIFTHYVDGSVGPVDLEGGDSWRINPGPLILSAICSDWRGISLSMPVLWARLHVFFPDFGYRPRAGLVSLLQHWLPRAENTPIDLLLHGRPPTDVLQEVLPVVYKYLPQIRTLKLSANAKPSASEICGRLYSLESLQLLVPTNPPFRPPKSIAFSEAPRLRALLLYGPCSFDNISLPWHQLTRLDLSWIPDAFAIPILGQTPHLKHLQIIDIRPTGIVNSLVCITLSHLHTFRLHSSAYKDSFSMIGPYLALPSLRNLELDVPDWKFSQLSELGTRSQWTLRTLKLHDAPYADAAAFMEFNPFIESLEIITSYDTTNQLLQRLGSDRTFVPNLRSLTVSQHRLTEISLMILVDVARSRWMQAAARAGAKQLRSLWLWTEPDTENAPVDEIALRFHDMVQEGFSFSVFRKM